MITPLSTISTTPATSTSSHSLPGTSSVDQGVLESAVISFRRALARVEGSEHLVDHAIRRISRGGDLDAGQLLAVQSAVYRAAQQSEMVARAINRVNDTVREITQIKI